MVVSAVAVSLPTNNPQVSEWVVSRWLAKIAITYVYTIYIPSYLFSYLSTYLYREDLLLYQNLGYQGGRNLVEVHPQLSHNGHPMDGALMMDPASSLFTSHHHQARIPRIAQFSILIRHKDLVT
jgi:hypothetical protein